MIAEALRRGRNAAYRIASPADAWLRRLAGKPSLPPLWLRRHTGAVSRFESAARETGAFLDSLGLLEPGHLVLDAGCGSGAMVPELLRRLGTDGRYVGFDVHEPSIRWCRSHWADPRLSFELARVASAYGDRSGPAAATYRFPLDDGRADLVLAKSLFTHLMPDDAARYLSEIRRCLRPGRAAVVTAFLFDPSDAPALGRTRRAFPHASSDGDVRWRFRSRPAAAVAYAGPRFDGLLAAAGLRLQWMSPGFFPGADRLASQDVLLLGH